MIMLFFHFIFSSIQSLLTISSIFFNPRDRAVWSDGGNLYITHFLLTLTRLRVQSRPPPLSVRPHTTASPEENVSIHHSALLYRSFTTFSHTILHA